MSARIELGRILKIPDAAAIQQAQTRSAFLHGFCLGALLVVVAVLIFRR